MRLYRKIKEYLSKEHLNESCFSKSIAKAAEVIKSGGLVICPSEGVYGISCSVFNEDAVKK